MFKKMIEKIYNKIIDRMKEKDPDFAEEIKKYEGKTNKDALTEFWAEQNKEDKQDIAVGGLMILLRVALAGFVIFLTVRLAINFFSN